MDECIEVLENSPDAIASDQIICQWVKLQHLVDDISIQFMIEDPASCETLDAAMIKFAIQGFESRLRTFTSHPLRTQKPGEQAINIPNNIY